MSHAKADWLPVSRSRPCPVCERESNCKVSSNGEAVWCGRVPSDRQNAGGQYFHRIKNRPEKSYKDRPRKKATYKAASRVVASLTECKSKSEASKPFLPYWAERYAVPVSAWLAINAIAGADSITIPEVNLDAPGFVCGLVTRSRSIEGSRWKCGAGHSRGSTIAGMPAGDGLACLIVEGGTDAASAVAMGCDVASRFTRDAPLDRLAKVLAEVPPDQPIIVLVENDLPKHSDCTAEQWVHHLFFSAVNRASLLADELGRPVVVASPPADIGDLNEWWKIETESFGHLLGSDERFGIGRTILDELLETGKEVLPSPEIIKNHKLEKLEELRERVYLNSEILRQLSIERGRGIDSDYEAADSCSFYKSFNRRNDEKKMNEYLFGFLSCKSWKCVSCRERKLKPDWLVHLVEIFASCDLIYRTCLSDPACVAKDYRSTKRLIHRHDGNFVAIELGASRKAIYSTVETKQDPRAFRIGTHRAHFDELISILDADISGINSSCGRPISTCREWSQGEPPTAGDMLFKIERIAEVFEGRLLYVTTMPVSHVDEVLAGIAKRNRTLVDRSERCEFIAVRDGGTTVIMTSRPITGSVASPAEFAVVPVAAVVKKAAAELGDDWRDAVRSSPRWTPKPTKQWRPLGSDASPSIARIAAAAVRVKTFEFEPEPTAAFCDGVSIQFSDGEFEQEQSFISRITK